METLSWALWRAAQGRRDRGEIARALEDSERWLSALASDIVEGQVPDARWTAFPVFDPKPRQIHAPCFRDRVLHHAMMHHAGPILERSWTNASYACRRGGGTHQAVRDVQRLLRRGEWVVHADVRSFFASIRHRDVMAVLRRRFKSPAFLALWARILETAPVPQGVGLPIGALTSQYAANAVLDGADRLLLARKGVVGVVRYMDDLVFVAPCRREALAATDALRGWLALERGLAVRWRMAPCRDGVAFLGVKVSSTRLRLSRRRRLRYQALRRKAEVAWAMGRLGSLELQRRADAALAVTAHTDAAGWRRRELSRRGAVDA